MTSTPLKFRLLSLRVTAISRRRRGSQRNVRSTVSSPSEGGPFRRITASLAKPSGRRTCSKYPRLCYSHTDIIEESSSCLRKSGTPSRHVFGVWKELRSGKEAYWNTTAICSSVYSWCLLSLLRSLFVVFCCRRFHFDSISFSRWVYLIVIINYSRLLKCRL